MRYIFIVSGFFTKHNVASDSSFPVVCDRDVARLLSYANASRTLNLVARSAGHRLARVESTITLTRRHIVLEKTFLSLAGTSTPQVDRPHPGQRGARWEEPAPTFLAHVADQVITLLP
jgi:hypothetical protein